MAMEAETGVMSKEEFHVCPEYNALPTANLKKWVDTFVLTQDAVHSTGLVYGTETSQAYRAMLTNKIESNPRVVAALDAYFKRTSRERFLRDLKQTIEHTDGIARVEALKLLARTNGFVKDSGEPHDLRVPANATPLVDNNGVVRGYRTTDGEYVQLADVEVAR